MEDRHAFEPIPKYRGVLHMYAFWFAILGTLFLLKSSPTNAIFFPMLIYGISMMGLFGVSAIYHRRTWKPPARKRMGKIDRTMIYIFIAGNYTPFAMLGMHGVLPKIILWVLWSSVLLGAFINFFWYSAPNWIHSILYLIISWACAVATPQLWNNLGGICLIWIVVGGLLHTIGAAVYAMRKPNPYPKIFGFHEIFHCFVTLAIAVHYAVVAHYLLPISSG